MRSENLIKALQSLSFTRELEHRHLEKLASLAQEVAFSEGDMIFREGDMDDKVYIIQEGKAAVEIRVPGRGRITILTVGPGELIGWSSLFPPRHKTASVRSITDTRAIAVDGTKLRAACEEDHDLGYTIIWRVAEVIAQRLKATRLQLVDMFAPSS